MRKLLIAVFLLVVLIFIGSQIVKAGTEPPPAPFDCEIMVYAPEVIVMDSNIRRTQNDTQICVGQIDTNGSSLYVIPSFEFSISVEEITKNIFRVRMFEPASIYFGTVEKVFLPIVSSN